MCETHQQLVGTKNRYLEPNICISVHVCMFMRASMNVCFLNSDYAYGSKKPGWFLCSGVCLFGLREHF